MPKAKWSPLAPALVLYTIQFVIPLLFVAYTSFRTNEDADFTLESYQAVLGDAFFRNLFSNSILVAAAVAGASAILAYPIAYAMVKGPVWVRGVLMALVLVPWFTNSVVRAFGWSIIFDRDGILSKALSPLADERTGLMGTFGGVWISLTHVLVPFMVFALYGVISNIDDNVLRAAHGLGAGPVRTFATITFPLTIPGLTAGTMLVFGTAASNFVTPSLIGGVRYKVVPTEVYNQAMNQLNWPLASVLALGLMMLVVISELVYSTASRRWSFPT